MAWFRAKTLPRDVNTITSDSSSSFVRIPEPGQLTVSAVAMSSTSSVAQTAEGTQENVPTSPSILIEEPEPASRPPLAVSTKINIPSPALTSTSLLSALPLPSRTKSNATTETAPVSAVSASVTVAKSASRPVRSEDNRLRITSSAPDQGALTSQVPEAVLKDVMEVMNAMGLEVKTESEYKLRCTRVKKRRPGSRMSMSPSSGGRVSGAPHCFTSQDLEEASLTGW